MATGLPVIGSNAGGIKEVIDNNTNGLLFEAKDTKDLYSKIKWCILNKAERTVLGRNAKKTVQSDYSINKVELQRLQVFNRLIQGRH